MFFVFKTQGSPALTPVTVTISPLLDDRPEPPPIETIPTKKNQAEKRTRRAVKETLPPTTMTTTTSMAHHRVEKPPLAKLYVKNSGTQRGRPLMRQKSASPLKETPPGFKGGSPLFNIRYKSLTNLQQAMELDGTLDSSHSGGRTSGDSGAGAKLPEKRCVTEFCFLLYNQAVIVIYFLMHIVIYNNHRAVRVYIFFFLLKLS